MGETVKTGEIEAIKSRLAAATPGPWDTSDLGPTEINRPGPKHIIRVKEDTDAQFIAHAPTDIAALLAEVESLTHQKETLVGICRDLQTRIGKERGDKWK